MDDTTQDILARLDMILKQLQRSLDVCTDTDCSDSYKAGYCESSIDSIYHQLSEVKELMTKGK